MNNYEVWTLVAVIVSSISGFFTGLIVGCKLYPVNPPDARADG